MTNAKPTVKIGKHANTY